MIQTVEKECYAPARPVLKALDETKHIGARANVETLILNVADIAVYAESLEAALNCYAKDKD